MSLSPEKTVELHDLVGQLCNEDLRHDAFTRLVALLDGDGEAQQLYVRYLDMHESLRELAVGIEQRATLSEIQNVIASLSALDAGQTDPSPTTPSNVDVLVAVDERYATEGASDRQSSHPHPTAAAPLPIEPEDEHPLINPGRTTQIFGVLTSGAVGWTMFALLLIAFAGYRWITGRQNAGDADVTSVAVEPTHVAELSASGVSSVQLDSGTATLKLPGIGQVIVEGPAQFDMLSAKRARLNSGRIKMRVTEKEGRGFVVETPYGEVTDLGTEFGLDLSERGKAGLVVFEGAVDLSVAGSQWAGARDAPRVERLVGGEGLEFGGSGRISRIMSIVTGSVPTFRSQPDGNSRELDRSIILRVTDNRQVKETKKFYEVVPHGLREDALAYVDRPHEWNGVNEAGLPSYLIDADYVRTFNQDNAQKSLEINVTLAGPAKLYVFFDERFPLPDWLKDGFHDTGDKIGKDSGRWGAVNRNSKLARGAGLSIDHQHSIWERTVKEAGTITLGAPNEEGFDKAAGAMYGIAAVPLSDEPTAGTPSANSTASK